jgi:hypothetical protein
MVKQKNYKFLITVSVAVLFVLAAVALATAAVIDRGAREADTSSTSSGSQNTGDEDNKPKDMGDAATFEGEYECLPKSGPGPHTMECAFGLLADDGKHYGLDMTEIYDSPDLAPGFSYQIGDRLRVSGTLQGEPVTGHESSGTFKVQSVELAE